MGERLFLVVDQSSLEINTREGAEDHTYRPILLTGATYRESSLRQWIGDRWNTQPDASIDEIADAASAGGWTIFEARGTQSSDSPTKSPANKQLPQ
jgi:hypothetical protein